MNFTENVRNTLVEEKQAAIFWLGQAGFLVKTAQGRLIAIDPYFSNCVLRIEKQRGFQRLMPPPCAASDLKLDVLIMSHEHNDHFDVDSMQDLIRGSTQVYTNSIVADQLTQMGFSATQIHVMKKGMSVELDEFTLHTVDCDHGPFTPEALGFVLDFGFSKLYYAGDTALSPERLKTPLQMQPDVAILPINGAYGNMNGIQAAEYAGMLHCGVCIPCHFWTFPLHHGDPQEIIDHIETKAPDCELVLLCQGEHYLMRQRALPHAGTKL